MFDHEGTIQMFFLVTETLIFMEKYFEKLQRRDTVQSALERKISTKLCSIMLITTVTCQTNKQN